MDENNNFLDKNTLMAVALSILFFVGWQAYMQKQYPDAYAPKEEIIDVEGNQNKADLNGESSDQSIKRKKIDKGIPGTVMDGLEGENPEMAFEVSNDEWWVQLSNRGMGLEIVELKKYSDREENAIRFEDKTNKASNFGTYYNGKPLYFQVEKKQENHFIGTSKVAGQTIVKEMIFDSSNYTVQVSIKTLEGAAAGNDVFETKIASEVLQVESSMFTPAYEGTEFFSIDDGSEERERLDIESQYDESFSKTTLTSIGSQYFAVAVSDRSPIIPKNKLSYNPKDLVAYGSVFHQAATNGNKTDIQFTGFVGPKKYDVLKELDPNFVKMINYGMFSVLSKPMLSMLKWLFGMFKNWGLAIILLTIMIRMLLLPINISSLKSMKKMQKIQPQLKAIKEKYKDDPVRVNQETMALMKKEKANPLGGCLPMLLQLPVFFALYSVLGQSVELYKSPFIFWIKDLSYQDPFFVLPVAVGVLYFIQMSITPQPTDPAQAKVMKFIPILFCFFMITVPSGLTLYFFVNTVFGIGQSFIFQREKKKAAAA